MRVIMVVGTRPEIIKMAPIVWELNRLQIPHLVYFSGQHSDPNMSTNFFAECSYPVYQKPYFGSPSPTAILDFLKAAKEEDPNTIVLAEGDTHTVGFTAVASVAVGLPFGHVEAGLRCFDKNMREERYRRMADEAAQFLFCPLPVHRENVKGCLGKSFIVGNTIADVVESVKVAKNQALKPYALMTFHRFELIQDTKLLVDTLQSLAKQLASFRLTAILPVHPHTASRLGDKIGFDNISIIDPVPYHKMIELESHARLILTDSGGVQEEALILRVPCGILRNSTERSETLSLKAGVMVDPRMVEGSRIVDELLSIQRSWKHPYGSGVGAKIVDTLLKFNVGGRNG